MLGFQVLAKMWLHERQSNEWHRLIDPVNKVTRAILQILAHTFLGFLTSGPLPFTPGIHLRWFGFGHEVSALTLQVLHDLIRSERLIVFWALETEGAFQIKFLCDKLLDDRVDRVKLVSNALLDFFLELWQLAVLLDEVEEINDVLESLLKQKFRYSFKVPLVNEKLFEKRSYVFDRPATPLSTVHHGWLSYEQVSNDRLSRVDVHSRATQLFKFVHIESFGVYFEVRWRCEDSWPDTLQMRLLNLGSVLRSAGAGSRVCGRGAACDDDLDVVIEVGGRCARWQVWVWVGILVV